MKIKIFNYTISIIKNKKRYRKRKYKSKDDRPRKKNNWKIKKRLVASQTN